MEEPMKDQKLNTHYGVSQEFETAKPLSRAQAHMFGGGALSLAVGLWLLFDLQLDTARWLFTIAVLFYGGLYGGSEKAGK
jgi:hypothetical protein